MRVKTFFSQLLQDVTFATRVVAKRPGTTAIIVLSLALGIGANTLVFSLVNGILLRALPFPEPERLVGIWVTPPKQPQVRANLANAAMCLDLPKRESFFTSAGCYIGVSGNVADPADAVTRGPEWLRGEMLTYHAAKAIGVTPIMGRWFSEAEDNGDAEKVMLISYKLWQRRFNGARDIIGQRLRVADFGGNDTPSTIIGVLPEGFEFANTASDYFVPLRATGRGRNSPVRNRSIVARLKPGVTLEQAQEAANQLATGFAIENPANKGWSMQVVPVSETLIGGLRRPFEILQGTALLVLLIACANVGGLLLAEGATRQRELAVRAALGSGRWRIVRQLLTESVVLSAVGAVACIACVGYGLSAFVNWLPPGWNRLDGVTIDRRVLFFTILVSLITAVVFGLLPALQASRLDLTAAFRSGDRRSTPGPGRLRLRSAFVVLQIAAAVVLLTGAGLLLNTLLRFYSVDPGFDPKHITTFQMAFTGRGFFGSKGRVTPSGSLEMELNPRIRETVRQLRDQIASTAGVDAVTTIGVTSPLGGSGFYNFSIVDRPPVTREEDTPGARWYPIGSDYFKVLNVPLIRGREFGDADSATTAPVAMISETMAKRFWPNEDPIGKQIKVTFYNDAPREIVGIVRDIITGIRQRDSDPQLYVPYAQLPTIQEGRTAFGLEGITFVVRSRARTDDWLPHVRQAAQKIDPAHAISQVEALEDFAKRQSQGFRQYATLLVAFSGIALLLAVVGIYGVMSHSVAQRTNEIGIRVAFGATWRHVLTRVMGQGLIVIAIGMAIGLAASLQLTKLVENFLFGVTATDPTTFGLVLAGLFVVACLACLVPARRALKVDPLIAMRSE